MNTRVKKVTLRIIIPILMLLALKGVIYRNLIEYRDIESRKAYKVEEKNLDKLVNECFANNEFNSIEKIVDISLLNTAKHIKFTSSSSSQNPNKIITTKKANCIGYSNFFVIICNKLLVKNGLDDWEATTYKGQLFLFDKNIHKYFSSSFFKYHDFVIITNNSTKETIAVDPSLYDYFGIGRVSIDNSKKTRNK